MYHSQQLTEVYESKRSVSTRGQTSILAQGVIACSISSTPMHQNLVTDSSQATVWPVNWSRPFLRALILQAINACKNSGLAMRDYSFYGSYMGVTTPCSYNNYYTDIIGQYCDAVMTIPNIC